MTLKLKEKYEPAAVDAVMNCPGFELVEMLGGCLVDNYLLFNNITSMYICCVEQAATCWTSCYAVYTGDNEVLNLWEKLNEN